MSFALFMSVNSREGNRASTIQTCAPYTIAEHSFAQHKIELSTVFVWDPGTNKF